MRIQMFGATDVGLVRSNNQDSLFYSPEYGIAIVSDGMGGHLGGEIASQLVVNGLKDAFLSSPQILAENVGPFLDEVLGQINAKIFQTASEDESLKGMGATVNYLQFGGGLLAIGHAGDTRTYLIRAFRRRQRKLFHGIWCLTIDHNVETFVARGLLIEGRDFPQGSLDARQKARLTRGMGVLRDLAADLYTKNLQDGDVFLTCSDGLHGFASDSEILRAVVSGPIEKAASRLIQLAKSKGAPDNVTVVLAICSDLDDPLHNVLGAYQDSPPFYVRQPNGTILGSYTWDQIVKLQKEGVFGHQTEVACSLQPWCMLGQRDKLEQVYPEFKSMREDLPTILSEEPTQKYRRTRIFLPKWVVAAFLTLVLVAWAVALLYSKHLKQVEVREAPATMEGE